MGQHTKCDKILVWWVSGGTYIILIVILIIAKCNCRTQTKIAERFVNPPIPTADIPFTDYSVDAAKGDTIIYPSGSVLLFPKDAFVDKNGKPINRSTIRICMQEYREDKRAKGKKRIDISKYVMMD